MATASVRLFTAGLQSEAEWPKWFYQDLAGELQGPFDASTMIRWYSDNQLPLDLKVVGVHPQDCSAPPTTLAQFQALQKLMDNAEAGMQYTPVRMMKGTSSEEGPATPQVAVPPKGNRITAGPAGNHMLPQNVGGSVSAALAQQLAGLNLPATTGGSDSRPDVTRAVDQRLVAGMPGLSAQRLHMQGRGLLQQLQAQQQLQQQQQMPLSQRGGSAPRQLPGQKQQQQPGRNGSSTRPTGSGTSLLHEQHMQHMQQMAAAAAAAAASAGDEGAAASPEILPGSEAWNNALTKLISREGFSGKDADLKWRVILASGDRIGPFSSDQMLDWLVRGSPPKGINKQQASQTAANPSALQLCGIMSSDYNAQRLPGAKFFKPLGQLVPAVAGGLVYEAVNKHDLQRGLPKPNWNEPGAAGAASEGAIGGAAAGLPAGSGAKGPNMQGGKAGKAGKGGAGGSNSRGGSAGRGANQNQMGSSSKPRSGAAGLAGAAAAAAASGLDGAVAPAPAPKSTFQHPMALRQQQRQQQQQQGDGLSAAAAAASEALGGPRTQQQQQAGRGPSTVSPGGAGVQAGKAFDKGQGAFGSRPSSVSGGSASRGILMAANSTGGVAAAAAAAAAQQQQQQQPGCGQAAPTQAAVLAAAGQLGQAGLATMRQQQAAQQQLQMQMQGLSVGTPTAATAAAYMQGTAHGMPQAMWLKQHQQPQQMPNQAVASMFAAQQSLLGYQMQAGYAALNQAAAAQAAAASGEDASQGASSSNMLPNGTLPRTSSTGSNAVQHNHELGKFASYQQQQQQQPTTGGSGGPHDWQQHQQHHQQQQGGDQQGAAAAGGMPGQQQQQHLTPQQMQAAALLFLQHEQQQQMIGNREPVRWWVQRSERAFSGPFSGLQMYQAYLQPGVMRLTDGTCIAVMAGGSNSRDMPAARAFVPLGALLEAAMQGYCLVPCTIKDSVQQAGPSGGNPPTVRHATTGAVIQLQQVVPSVQQQLQQQQHAFAVATQQQPQQQQQHPSMDGSYSGTGGIEASKQQRRAASMMHAGVSAAPAGVASNRTGGGVPPSPSKHRGAAPAGAVQQSGAPAVQLSAGTAAGTQFVAAPGGGLVAIPAGATAASMLPSGSMLQPGAGMGGVMAAQGMPMVAAAAPMDAVTVASALFTAGNVPPPMAPVWFVLSPATEPHVAPKAQGPYEPADMLAMYCEQRIGPGSLVCATHRPVPGQPQTQPPPNAFQPLHALLATTSNDLMCQQVNAAAAAAAMGGHMGTMMPAAALMQGGQMGQMPIMIQVPVSGGQGGAAMAVAVPAGMQMQMQQLHQMQMQGIPQGGPVTVGPYMQQAGTGMQQHMTGAAQQQQQPPGADECSHSNSAASHAANTPGQQQQQQQGQSAQRSGPVPTRVDTWGSLDAHERAPTSSSSAQQQQQQQQQQHQLAQHMSAGAQAVEAALASRRTSGDSHHSLGAVHTAAGMMGMGTLWVQQQQQQQQQRHQSGPRSSNSGSHGQFPQQQHHLHHHQQQMLVRRTSSSSSRSNANSEPASNGADAAAVAAALASAGNVSASMGVGSSGVYGVHAQQQQLHSALLAGIAPSAAMTGIPEHQPQLVQPPPQQHKQAVAAAMPSPTPSAEGSTAAADTNEAAAAGGGSPASAASSEVSAQNAAGSQ